MLSGLLAKRGGRMRYRKKPVEIEAVQWTGENLEEIEEFAKGYVRGIMNAIEIINEEK